MTMPDPPGRQVVAPGEVIASEWGNNAWDQSVVRFLDAAQRDDQWPSPPDGALCQVLSPARMYQTYRAGNWREAGLEITPGGILAGDMNPRGGMRWVVGSAVALTNGAGAMILSFAQPGRFLVAVIPTPGDTQGDDSCTSFDYRPDLCQVLYIRGGVAYPNVTVRINYVAVLAD